MTDSTQITSRYRVDDLEIDAGTREVRRGDELLDLPGLSFNLLLALVRAAPNVLSHDDLEELAWDGRPVSPETITQRVKLVRDALNDSSESPRYISVIRGHGYRMKAPVSTDDAKTSGEAAAPVSGRRPFHLAILMSVIALLIVMVWTITQKDSSVNEPGSVPNPDMASIAVLAFDDLSENRDQEYFSSGMSETLIRELAQVTGLKVIAKTSSFYFKDKEVRIIDIADELQVGHVLEGSVQKAGNRVRVTAQLIDVSDNSSVWSENFDRTLDDIFVVQDEIASKVAQALEVTLLGKSQAERMIDPGAYVLYLKGQHFLSLSPRGNLRRSEEFLLQAIELETGYAEAWTALARNYYLQTFTSVITREEGVALANNAIERAKSIDPDLGIAWGVDGYLKNHLDWDWGAAQAAINKAYELEPNNNVIRRWRASTAHTLGKLDEAIELYERAILNDPLSMGLYSALGNLYMKVHRYGEAIETFEKQAELSPAYYWTFFNLGKSYLFRGEAEQALLEIKKNPENVYRIVGLVMAYSTLGREAEAYTELQRLVSDYGEKNPVWVAEAYSWRGQKDEAFIWLEKAYLQRDSSLSYMLGNNVFYSLKDDPRWVNLLKEMNLLEYWLEMPAEYGGPTD
jgi:TolB-like protein/DNA-binding winged helix-turn-helix (wHTH) protein/lipoprotein NlpI